MSRSTVRVILGSLAALVLVAGAGAGIIWWKIAGLKESLVGGLEKALGASVQVTSIDLDVWKGELHAVGITLVNQKPTAPWDKGDIAQATVRFHLSDLLAPTLPLTVEVSSWNVVLHSPLRTAETPPAEVPLDATTDATESHGPGRIQVTQITAQQGGAEIDFSDDSKAMVHGISFTASNNGAGVWTTHLEATSVTAGSLTAGASSVQIRGEQNLVTFSDLHMPCDPGVITGEGQVTLGGSNDAEIDLKAVDVPVTMLVAVEWQMKLSGLASGDLHYKGNNQSGLATGKLAVNHGIFNVLPWLDKVTSLVGLQDVSGLEVDKATADFEWKDHNLQLTNLDVRKNDVTRISGTVVIDAQDQIDGNLELGLPSSVTTKWPQIQNKVFPEHRDDYNWADVHLTGTPAHLEEDLTSRLISASLGQGADMLNQAASSATDLFNSFLGKASPSPQPSPAPPPSSQTQPSPPPQPPAQH